MDASSSDTGRATPEGLADDELEAMFKMPEFDSLDKPVSFSYAPREHSLIQKPPASPARTKKGFVLFDKKPKEKVVAPTSPAEHAREVPAKDMLRGSPRGSNSTKEDQAFTLLGKTPDSVLMPPPPAPRVIESQAQQSDNQPKPVRQASMESEGGLEFEEDETSMAICESSNKLAPQSGHPLSFEQMAEVMMFKHHRQQVELQRFRDQKRQDSKDLLSFQAELEQVQTVLLSLIPDQGESKGTWRDAVELVQNHIGETIKAKTDLADKISQLQYKDETNWNSLQEQIVDLEAQNAKSATQHDELQRSSLSELQLKQAAIDELREEAQSLIHTKDLLQQEVALKTEALKDSKEHLLAEYDRSEKIDSDLAHCVADIQKSLEIVMRGQSEQAEKLDMLAKAPVQKPFDVQDAFGKLCQEFRACRESVDALQKESRCSWSKLALLEMSLDENTERLSKTLQSTNRSAEKSSHNSNEQLLCCLSSIIKLAASDISKEFKQLQAQRTQVIETLARYEHERRENKQETAQLRAEQSKLKEINGQLARETQSIRKSWEELQTSCEAKQASAQSLHEEVARYKEEILRSTSERQRLEQSLLAAEAQIVELSDQVMHSQKQREIENERTCLVQSVSDAKAEYASKYNLKLREFQNQLKEHADNEDILRSEVAALQKKARLTAELQVKLAAAEKREQDLRDEMDALRDGDLEDVLSRENLCCARLAAANHPSEKSNQALLDHTLQDTDATEKVLTVLKTAEAKNSIGSEKFVGNKPERGNGHQDPNGTRPKAPYRTFRELQAAIGRNGSGFVEASSDISEVSTEDLCTLAAKTQQHTSTPVSNGESSTDATKPEQASSQKSDAGSLKRVRSKQSSYNAPNASMKRKLSKTESASNTSRPRRKISESESQGLGPILSGSASPATGKKEPSSRKGLRKRREARLQPHKAESGSTKHKQDAH